MAELRRLRVWVETEGPCPAGRGPQTSPGQKQVRRREAGRGTLQAALETRDISRLLWLREGRSRLPLSSFNRAQTQLLPSLSASSPFLQPRAYGPAWKVPGPLGQGAFSGRLSPTQEDRCGGCGPDRQLWPGRPACGRSRTSQFIARSACSSDFPSSLLPAVVWDYRHQKGRSKRLNKHQDWVTGLPHSPPSPTPSSTFSFDPEGSIMVRQERRQGQRAASPALGSSQMATEAELVSGSLTEEN